MNRNYVHVLIDIIETFINKTDEKKVANAYTVIASRENMDTIYPEEVRKYSYCRDVF